MAQTANDEKTEKGLRLRQEIETEQKDIKENVSKNNEKTSLNQKTEVETASRAFENILHRVGDYGFYQWKLMIITGFCGVFTSLHNMGAVFLGATPDYWCDIPYFKENNVPMSKTDLNVTVPWVHGRTGTLEPSKCTYFNYDYASLLKHEYTPVNKSTVDLSTVVSLASANITKCNSWIYDDSVYKSTAVTEWDLVCGSRWMMSSIQASYMMGILSGAVIFSAVSDKMGRRVASLICCCLFFIASVSVAFTHSFVLFLILRFIVAGAGQGMFLVTFILLMETVSLKGRNVMGNLFHIGFSFGFMSLCLLAYLFRDWRHLQMAISFPTVLLLGYYWVLPESPRWLLMHGREEEGLTILKTIAKSNKREFPSEEEIKPNLTIIREEVSHKPHISAKEKIKSVFHSVVILVRTPNMRRRNLIVFYGWFVTSMIYYGLTFSSANITESPYLSVFIAALVELPCLLTIYLLFWFGRRTVLSASFLCGGIACIAVVLIPLDQVGWNVTLTSLGKMCLSSSFLLVFMLSAELVPTHVRNISIGIASMFARIGSGIAPYILDLLGDIYYAIPLIIFGTLSILAGLLSLLLPETGNKRLPESVEEIEAMPR